MWKLTKQYWKDMWASIWSKTTIDEKTVATVKEIKKRYKLTVDELSEAIKEVGNQLGDIDDAVKGKPRKGRKKKDVK